MNFRPSNPREPVLQFGSDRLNSWREQACGETGGRRWQAHYAFLHSCAFAYIWVNELRPVMCVRLSVRMFVLKHRTDVNRIYKDGSLGFGQFAISPLSALLQAPVLRLLQTIAAFAFIFLPYNIIYIYENVVCTITNGANKEGNFYMPHSDLSNICKNA